MARRTLSTLVGGSITVKICLVILLIETTLLFFMGLYYFNRFSNEIDNALAEKLHHVSTHMSHKALSFDAVSDIDLLTEVVDEEIINAFIVQKSGEILYALDPAAVGDYYIDHLDTREAFHLLGPNGGVVEQTARHAHPSADHFISTFSPIRDKENLIGYLYLKVRAEVTENRKREVLYLLVIGSLLMIFLTTLIEAFWVHRLFVPRIREMVTSLHRVEKGELTARAGHDGPSDQIGTLINSVNSMIGKVDFYTRNLQGLAEAGEELAEAKNPDEVYEILLKVIERRFPVEKKETRPVDDEGNCGVSEGTSPCYADSTEKNLAQKGEIVLSAKGVFEETTPSGKAEGSLARLLIPRLAAGMDGQIVILTIRLSPGNSVHECDSFVRTLGRLMTSALKRTEALGELRQAEKRYRNLFTGAVEGIFISSPDGRVLEANPAIALMMGYRSPEDFLGHVSDLGSQVYVNPEDREKFVARIREEGVVRDFQTLLRRKNGETFLASLWAHSIRDERGELKAISGSILDISQRKRIEEEAEKRRLAEAAHDAQKELLTVLEMKNRELRTALDDLQSTQAKLIQSEKMAVIGTMAGGVAHDLNNILAGILSYPDLLLMQLPPESGLRESIEVIKESGVKAAAIVSDLLTMSRKAAYNTVIFDINDLVENYLSSAEFKELSSRYPTVHVRSHLQSGLRFCKCSPIHLEKVIMNLVTNAVEAVDGDGFVDLSTENTDVKPGSSLAGNLSPGEYVVFKVADSGPGIPPQDLQRIFEPFYSSKVIGRSGTGLGLAVVWNAVREHGGFVAVASDENGTVFKVYLPSSKEVPTAVRPSAASLQSMQTSGTVLIVDDERYPREIAAKMVAALGYTVESASSGEEALEILKKRNFDIVILDMIMEPGLSGFETYRKIVAFRPEQRAVVTSGYTEHKDLSRAIELGIKSFLRKPFTTAQLADILRKTLGSSG